LQSPIVPAPRRCDVKVSFGASPLAFVFTLEPSGAEDRPQLTILLKHL